MEALDIRVKGIVQGVGFRPFVYRVAHECALTGWVLNSVEGVLIHAEGDPDQLDAFVIHLSEHAPAASHVKEIELEEVSAQGFDDFRIHFSDDEDAADATFVSPDLATCDQCLEELFDPSDRRYRYPFINCTNCGPRFTILDALPYDRPKTSMAKFTMCSSCQHEYDDPTDRRFHAQPDACFICGPHLGWVGPGTLDAEPDAALVAEALASEPTASSLEDIQWAQGRGQSDAALAHAVAALRAGGIVAVKGLGGYHLACDATNPEALAKLRARKHREGKGFAVMAASADAVRDLCHVSAVEEEQLKLPARPIVLLRKRATARFAQGLADGLPELGVMLPATPLQHLLLHDFGGMLVMTSGNLHDEPIVTTEAAALTQLGTMADGFLVNDRDILSRYDDSVLRVLDAGEAGEVVQFVRRARGFAPAPLPLERACKQDILAVGPEQKNTFALTHGDHLFVSQHIGDMEDATTFDSWLATVRLYSRLLHIDPKVIAYDQHPEYLTTKWALEQALPTLPVQHHFAHVLSVMGENKLEGPVCGIAFDGTGYGTDGAIWGGEILLANRSAFERFANFAYFPLPGGAAAVRNPDRTAFGALWAFDLLEHPAAQPLLERLGSQAQLLEQLIAKGLTAPVTSSAGRLFDAASAVLGVCSKPSYQGEAAILLEGVVHQGVAEGLLDPNDARAYHFEVLKNTATEGSTAQDTSVVLFDFASTFEAMLDDLQEQVPVAAIAQRFHNTMVTCVLQAAQLVYNVYGITTVTLSGGVFLNRYLMERCLSRLVELGYTVAVNRDLPPSDASLSCGQAVLACNELEEE